MTTIIPKLSRLEIVPLRNVWKHEAHNFTQWLALEENLALLSETIDLDLVNAQTEVPAGIFRIDILAEDLNGETVVVENQLENTNHDHLGKIITYAAMHKATTIVWMVADVRGEHEQAINWLNEHTDEEVNIYLLQIKAVKIGNSPPAPVFDVIARPNRKVKVERRNSTLSPQVAAFKQQQVAFWEFFAERFRDEKSAAVTGFTKALPQQWLDIRIGSTKAHIAAIILQQPKQVEMQLYIPDNNELFEAAYQDRAIIEAKIGSKLEWMALPNRKAAKAKIIHECDFVEALEEKNEEMRDEIISWMVEKANIFAETFGPLIK